MDQPSKMHDLTEKKVNAPVKSYSEEWKKQAIYKMPTDKPRPESTSKAAQERIPYRDGKSLLARHRQQAYQKDSYVTPTLSDRPRSWHPRQGSDVQHKLNNGKSSTSDLGEPKGCKEQPKGCKEQPKGCKEQMKGKLEINTPKYHVVDDREWDSEK